MQNLITAFTFTWLGLVVGISFIEAPLKFRAPGITRELGLGIGRLVFTALNRVELVLAISIAVTLVIIGSWHKNLIFTLPIGILIIQTVWLLPALKSRIDKIVNGKSVSKSRHHILFIVLETLKVICLIIAGSLVKTGA